MEKLSVESYGFKDDSMTELKLNPGAQVQRRFVGREQNPLIVIDDLLLNPDDLVEAAAAADFAAPEGTWYPGGNAPLPETYLPALMPVLRPTLERAFDIPRSHPLTISGFFALATKTAEELSALQKIPHYDQPNPACLAILHYLGHGQTGGTGFFRHQATGYESVTVSRREAYMAAVADELEKTPPIGFAGPGTANYEMIDAVEPVFNRMVIYRSHVLHCALFDGSNLSRDPRVGRLTANTFCVPQSMPAN